MVEGRLWRRVRSAAARPGRLRDGAVFIVIGLVCAGLIFGVLYDVVDGALRRWADRDLSRRAHLVGVAVASAARGATPAALQSAFDELSASELAGNLLACTPDGTRLAATGLGLDLGCTAGLQAGAAVNRLQLAGRSALVTRHALTRDAQLFVVQDRTFLDARRRHILQILFVCAELALLGFLLLARAGWRAGSRRTGEAARSIVQSVTEGKTPDASDLPSLRLLALDVHRAVAQMNRTEGASRQRPAALQLDPGSLVVVANREPYAHERDSAGTVRVSRPASGLVTGIEPMLRSAGGTWIAYGGGSADRDFSDDAGRVAVPPEQPEYKLRRLFPDEEEYERYYSGFANEALWPLCHIAHVQPVFRGDDWAAYQSVNERFARAAAEEAGAEGLLLVQDYHFALVPAMVRERAPQAVTSLFWHIPWPNAEVVGICPWKEPLLEGMLGADLLGFHTRQYCLNFLETVQRNLECRVDLEAMSVTHGGRRTLVRPYPISVEWPYPAAPAATGVKLRRSLGIHADAHVVLGVDRADYTKGLIERVAAVEALLEQDPSMAGRFVYVQLASPTRTRISRYQQLGSELAEAVERVNGRFGTPEWQPVMLQSRTFSADEVREYYAMADSALVTPLHDGMNLVAKEYVASCQDGNGVLVLSQFAGAAKELDGALLVNPYDTQQVAQAIARAISMPLAEKRARMEAMREQIAANSIERWAERLLADMNEIRRSRARFWPRRQPVAAPPAGEVVAG